MAQIKWTETALNDLTEIAEYIALDKPAAANKLVSTFFNLLNGSRNFQNLVKTHQNYPNRIIEK